MENREQVIKNAKDFKDQITEQQDMDTIEASIMDNQLAFLIDDIKYKVDRPTFGQKQELHKAKIKKFNELIKDKDYFLKEDLKRQYKERNIDIDEMENKVFRLEVNKKDMKEKLGQLLVDKVSESEYKELKKQIQDIEEKQTSIQSKISELLDSCIEQQLFIYSYSYLIMMTVKVFKEEKWVRLWNNYEEFSNTEEALVNKIAFYAALILKDDIS